MSLLKKNKSNTIFYIILTIISLKMTVNIAIAKTYSKLEIQNIARDYVKNQYPEPDSGKRELKALKLNERIPDRDCETELSIATAHKQLRNRQVTVQIKCNDSKKWHQYVQIRVLDLKPIVITSQKVAKGELLTNAHLKIKLQPVHMIRDQYLSEHQLKSLIGSRTKRTIRAGAPVQQNQICMICKGDKVTIYANYRGLTVKTSGNALENGTLGQHIKVKNSKSGKKLDVKVLSIDKVQVSI